MSKLILSRASLRRDGSLSALANLLLPEGEDARIAAGHRLVWALFSDGPDRRRDFLWREEAPGRFMLLSRRPPSDPHGLFDLDSRAFAPALDAGDRLGFALRANPTVDRRTAPGQRSHRADVVMDALRALPPGEARKEARLEVATDAGHRWLAERGERDGFRLARPPRVDGYDQRRLPRGEGREAIGFSVLDIEGVLQVTDPARFLAALGRGFGRARAFGCGLMLIRRVPADTGMDEADD